MKMNGEFAKLTVKGARRAGREAGKVLLNMTDSEYREMPEMVEIDWMG
jgi:hypothetical protein